MPSSRLGQLIATVGHDEVAFLRALREQRLVRVDAAEGELLAALRRVRAPMPAAQRNGGASDENIRATFGPLLSAKGFAWTQAGGRTPGSVTLDVLGVLLGGLVVVMGVEPGGSYLVASGAGLVVVALGHLVAPTRPVYGLLAVVWGVVAIVDAFRNGAVLSLEIGQPAGRTAGVFAAAVVALVGAWSMLRRRSAA